MQDDVASGAVFAIDLDGIGLARFRLEGNAGSTIITTIVIELNFLQVGSRGQIEAQAGIDAAALGAQGEAGASGQIGRSGPTPPECVLVRTPAQFGLIDLAGGCAVVGADWTSESQRISCGPAVVTRAIVVENRADSTQAPLVHDLNATVAKQFEYDLFIKLDDCIASWLDS